MSQRGMLIAAGIMLIALVSVLAFAQGNIFARPEPGTEPNEDYPKTGSASGLVLDVAASAKVITLRLNNGTEVSAAVAEGTEFLDKNGREADFGYIRRGFDVAVEGNFTRADSLIAETVRVTNEPNIILYSPKPNEEVGLPAVIRGEARVFENSFIYRIKNKDGSVLVEAPAMAQSPDTGLYGPFEIRANYPKPKTGEGSIEVFQYSARDGSEIDMVTVPVRFATSESTAIKVYFSNRVRDPEALNCAQMYAVERRIEKTEAVAKRALEELLEGPTMTEGQQGYYTSLNSGVKIQSLVIENGTARVDFDETMEAGMGGSCRVTAVRAQITQTLKQFPTVKNVIISVNGRTEDILQP